MKDKYNVIIIGSGIAGMTAAIYLKRAGLDILLIEENTPGGQLNKINIIENYPGFIKTNGPDLAITVYNQVNELGIDFLFDKVIKTYLKGTVKKIITNNRELKCDYVIIATGRLSKKLFSDDEKYIGKGISYCALCDGHLYKGKDVAVVGGGNSALEEIIYLSNICNSVTVILKGDSFRGESYLVGQVSKKNNIKVMYNSNVSEYNIENNRLESITLDNNEIINVSGLFISIGSEPSANIFNVKKDKGFIIVNSKCMTNVENVYACGDVVKKQVYQLTTATSEGTVAAYSIIRKNKNSKKV